MWELFCGVCGEFEMGSFVVGACSDFDFLVGSLAKHDFIRLGRRILDTIYMGSFMESGRQSDNKRLVKNIHESQ